MTEEIITQEALNVSISELETEAAVPGVPVSSEVMQVNQSNIDEWKGIITILLGAGFGVIAPGWGVTKGEVDSLSEAYAPLMDKYCPDLSQFGLEIGAVLVTAAVFAPRVGMARKIDDGGETVVEDKKPPASNKKSKPKAKAKSKPKAKVSVLKSEEDR